MVLTQRDCSGPIQYTDCCFHTTMVLTQLDFMPFAEEILKVSIPLWFLRNKVGDAELSEIWLTFPYHYGSYATNRKQ